MSASYPVSSSFISRSFRATTTRRKRLLEHFRLEVNRNSQQGIPAGVQIRFGPSECFEEGKSMARGYSNDLRERVVAIVEDGESARETARLLNIGASTAIRWIKRWTKTGSVAAKPGTGHTRSPLEQHQQWLVALVAGEPDLTLHACEQPFDKALGHPDAMKQKWQVDIDQRIGSREPLPRESLTAKGHR